MRFYERFEDFRALRIMGKCTSRHLFLYYGFYFSYLGYPFLHNVASFGTFALY